MFANGIIARSAYHWQIWVERGHERARYTVLGEGERGTSESATSP